MKGDGGCGKYTDEIESIHFEIGDDFNHLVLRNELDLCRKVLNQNQNKMKGSTHESAQTLTSSAEKSD